MLVLSRKVHEQIFIGPEISIVVTRISGDRVRIGIDAPDHLQIKRGELIVADQKGTSNERND